MNIYDRSEERTGVQEASPYKPECNIQSDFVMVYGIHDIKRRADEWKKRGYIIHLMTGVAWGEYQDYLYGKFDKRDHHDEGQVDRRGQEINHGVDVPYMVPSIAFADYLIAKLKPAVDAGVEAIHLEEPEFWVRGGWSEAFKREWRIYYKEEWQDPSSSCEAQYRASKLKQYLYTRMLDRLCSALKEYALVKYNRVLRFYVPTHSLINYSQWRIVSPESALLDLPSIDGYIAQIWTGTSRTANVLRGRAAERTFMTAFLEYGIMQELVRGTDRRMWFLADPIEDSPNYTWADYRVNYFCTVAASLFHPGVYNYEVAPWPSRVFTGTYPREDGNGREEMPDGYRTEVLSMMQTLRNMKQDEVSWRGGKTELGVLIADSAMFQRVYPDSDESSEEARNVYFSSFYGLALPPLEAGYIVRPVQLDNIRRFAGYLNIHKALILSYEFMKPEQPDINTALAAWVKKGGVLIYVGDGGDSFHKIRAWWNTNGNSYANPAGHLFEQLGLPFDAHGLNKVGDGQVYIMPVNPSSLAMSSESADAYLSAIKESLNARGIEPTLSPEMILDRGPYTITALPKSDAPSCTLDGLYTDLCGADLKVVENPTIMPNSVGIYYNHGKLDKKASAEIIAAAARLEKLKITARSCSFTAYGAEKSSCSLRMYIKRPATSITAEYEGENIDFISEYDEGSKTLFIRFPNREKGVSVKVKFI